MPATPATAPTPAAAAAAIELPRALLAALVAELRIPITDTPWLFMAGTDLLDFPAPGPARR